MNLRKVKPTGPQPCPYLLIGERPGKVENSRGYCFCGPSGEELDRYLMVNSGLDRDNVRVCNLVPYYAEEPPTPEEVAQYLPELIAEINTTKPDFIGCVGLHSARALLGADIDTEWAHGLAFPIPHQWGQKAMVLIHVAAGLHQPSIAAKIQWDFTQFGKLIRGEELPTGHLADAVPEPHYGTRDPYNGAYHADQVICWPSDRVTALDTEGSVEKPWGWSACELPGTAVVMHKGGTVDGLTVLHNALADLPVLEALGVKIGRWTDTMLASALIGVEPLGLKPLAKRHCGMGMKSFSEVTAGVRRDRALEYIGQVIEWESTRLAKLSAEAKESGEQGTKIVGSKHAADTTIGSVPQL